MEEDDQPMMEEDHVSSPMKADVSMDMTDDCEGYPDNKNDSAEEEDNDDDDDEGELETPVVLRVKSASSSSSFRHHASLSSLRDSDGRSATGHPKDDTHQEARMMIAPLLEPPFAVDDKVLCPHGGSSSKRPSMLSSSDSKQLLLYPAVVRKMRYKASAASSEWEGDDDDEAAPGGARGQWEFWVHYVGWHARYDRWARSTELVRDSPDQRAQNVARLPPLSSNPATSTTPASRKRKKGTTETTNDGGSKGTADEAMVPDGDKARNAASTKALKRAAVGAAAGTATSREASSSLSSALYLEEYCELPFTLKTVLWDEWERLNPRDYLYHSPDQHNHVNGPAADVRASSRATTATAQGAAAPRTRLPTRVVHDLPSKATVRYVVSHFCKTAIQKYHEVNQQPQPQQSPSPKEGKGTAATTTSFSADTGTAKSRPPAVSSSSSVATPEQIQEFCNGLLQLFETALPLCLLYPQEHPQYEALLEEHKRNNGGRTGEPSSSPPPPLQLASVYGCEHLLRLLVRLPVLMQAGGHPAPGKDPQQSSSHNKWMGPLLRELIVLLQKNRSQIFTKSNYRPPHAPHEYLEWEQDLYYGLTAKRS